MRRVRAVFYGDVERSQACSKTGMKFDQCRMLYCAHPEDFWSSIPSKESALRKDRVKCPA